MRSFNEIFWKDVTYDNIESHKKPGFHSHFIRYISQKTTGEVKLTPPTGFRVNNDSYKKCLSAL